jgi:phage replication O-like protein O
MASPQAENGYTKIANEILEKLYEFPIDREPMRILLFILRKTYGYHKKRDRISLSQFVKALGKDRSSICRDIRKLTNMKIIVKIQNDDGTEYEFNKDYEGWVVAPTPRGTGDNKVVAPVTITPVAPTPHTKETITKEKNKRKPRVFFDKQGKEISLSTGDEYQADGWSPKDRLVMKRRIEKALGLGRSTKWTQLLYGSAWDFKKAFHFYQGYEYPDNIVPDEVAKTLANWYELGETRETVKEMMMAFFEGSKAKVVTITPNSVFSSHTYNSWKQNKL